MFDNNTYAGFRTANKHVLIRSYAIQVIWQNENVTKLPPIISQLKRV